MKRLLLFSLTFNGSHYVLVQSFPLVIQTPLPLAVGQGVSESSVIEEGTHQLTEEQTARACVVQQDGVQLCLRDEHFIFLCQLHFQLQEKQLGYFISRMFYCSLITDFKKWKKVVLVLLRTSYLNRFLI